MWIQVAKSSIAFVFSGHLATTADATYSPCVFCGYTTMALELEVAKNVQGGGKAIAASQFLQGSFRPHSLSSCPANSLETTTNDAAVKAITYMDNVQNKVLKDFSKVLKDFSYDGLAKWR